MHGVDKAAVLLLAPALAHGLPTTIISGPPKSAPEGQAVVSRLGQLNIFGVELF